MKKIIIVACLFLHSSAYALTLGTIRDEVRYLINDFDADTTARHYTDAILNERINIAATDIVDKTNCLADRYTITADSTSNEYALSSSSVTLKISRIWFQIDVASAAFKVLELTDFDTISKSDVEFENKAAGFPSKAVVYQNKLYLYPKVSSVYDDKKIRIDIIRRPNTMSSDSDIPFNNADYLYHLHPLIIWYVTAMCRADYTGDLTSDAYYKKYADEINFFNGVKK